MLTSTIKQEKLSLTFFVVKQTYCSICFTTTRGRFITVEILNRHKPVSFFVTLIYFLFIEAVFVHPVLLRRDKVGDLRETLWTFYFWLQCPFKSLEEKVGVLRGV